MPRAIYIAADNRITGFDRSRPQPIEAPWLEVTAEQFAVARAMPFPVWQDGQAVNLPSPPAEPPVIPADILAAQVALDALPANPTTVADRVKRMEARQTLIEARMKQRIGIE